MPGMEFPEGMAAKAETLAPSDPCRYQLLTEAERISAIIMDVERDVLRIRVKTLPQGVQRRTRA